jgi:hypothetical protein
MAVPIQDAHKFIRSILKKNKGGFVSPADIDMYLNRAVSDWISAIVFKYKKTKKFDYDHLLTKRASFSVIAGNLGLMTLPSDYLEGLTIYITVSGSLIEGTLYNWDEFLEVTNSKILAPTPSYSAATIYLDSTNTPMIQFAPVPVSGTYDYTLVYVKKPATAIYTYTLSGGNITDAATMVVNGNTISRVDLDISDRFLGDIYARTLMYLGVTLENPLLIQTEQVKDVNQKNDER